MRTHARKLRERFVFNRELGLRLASAAILAPLALAATWFGEFWFMIFVVLGGALVLIEWLRMIGAGSLFHLHAVGWALLCVVALAAEYLTLLAAVPVAVLAAVVAALAAWPDRSDIAARWVFVGNLYAGLAVAALVALRKGEDGFGAIAFVFLIAWSSDTAAFFVGRKLRGPKLWPRVSPSKTWSGAIGGFVGGVGAGALIMAWLGVPVTATTLLIAAIAAVSAQLGDLAESAAKRFFMIKDAGTLIPGHGGVMDRVDGIVAASLVTVAIGAATIPGAPARGLFALMGG